MLTCFHCLTLSVKDTRTSCIMWVQDQESRLSCVLIEGHTQQCIGQHTPTNHHRRALAHKVLRQLTRTRGNVRALVDRHHL
jgi:hypothetical protein